MKKVTGKTMMAMCMMLLVMLLAVPVSAASPKLSAKKATITAGFTKKLKVTGKGKKKVKWSSSNKKVATVNSKGVVTAKKKGTAIITAKVGSKKLKCKVTVKQNVYTNSFNWVNVATCNYEHMYFIRTAPTKLWYDSKGRLRAKVLINNQTLGSSYQLKRMDMSIRDRSGNVIAEGTFTWDYAIINPISTASETLIFPKDSTNVVNLTKLKGISWAVTTYAQ